MLLAIILAGVSSAGTLRVERDGSGDFTTIQPALDASAAGDTVLIGPGQYTERILYYLPGNGGWVEVGAYVQKDDLTVIGAGTDQTIIGTDTYTQNGESPKGLVYLGPASVTVEGIKFQNYFIGVFATEAVLYVQDCGFSNMATGISWWSTGVGGWIRDSYVTSSLGWGLGLTGNGQGMVIEGCTFDDSWIDAQYVQNLLVKDCEFFNGVLGLQFEAGVTGTIQNCRFHDLSIGIGLTPVGVHCSIMDSEVSGSIDAIHVQGDGILDAQNSVFRGGSRSCIFLEASGIASVRYCDLIDGSSGIAIKCYQQLGRPGLRHDFRGDYWGTTDPSQIADMIYDGHDDPEIHAEVLYTPFATGASDLVLALTPADSQVVIPDVGGSFQYDAYLENNTAGDIIADIAIEAVLPDGTVYPVQSYPGQTIPAASAYTRTGIVQDVPPGAPAGTYTYRVTASKGDTVIVDSDEFPFEKQGVVAAAARDMGWNLQGWDRDEPRTPPVTPAGFALHAATPNPFNPTTTLSFDLPSQEAVSLRVFDLQGRLVRTLLRGEALPQGRHEAVWDGRDDTGRQVASGTYFYRIEAGAFSQTRRAVLVK